ncbi:hypothetical protein PaelaDRAFT_1998 [Paenibacillus lactis 154]|uniref:Uncharacterized protein n=1 Tax=Paenibacillus lactis 154 TaxID=743719 RepID=G4HDE5_9BACL|nr:hypothetical protein PaelaDRAFT_1998 [Paenibacillus lactis 154]
MRTEQHRIQEPVDIKDQVNKYIQGKNGLIGLVIPPCDEPDSRVSSYLKYFSAILVVRLFISSLTDTDSITSSKSPYERRY